MGVNSSDTDFNTVEKIGGEKTHTLTIDEMPSHNHGIYLKSGQVSSGSNFSRISSTDYNVENGLMSNTGGSQPHNNLQPYITVYVWKRTA